MLDNTNIYGVIASEAISNIFKEGMWIKVLSPYALFLSGGNKLLVGNTITLNGITRAVVGATSGRVLIDRWGVVNVFIATGYLGVMGIVVNFYCISAGSIVAMFILNFIWAIFNGLWNSCMETEWAKSIVREKREEVNDLRQATNKTTTAMGPLFSLAIFLYMGNKWTLPLIKSVMIFGTAATIIPVLLCFTFRREAEIHQCVPLSSITQFDFAEGSIDCTDMKKADFTADPNGKVRLTYPLSQKSKFGKLRILTQKLRETKFILGKQYTAGFKAIPLDDQKLLVVSFNDESRKPVRALLDHMAIFLNSDEKKSVNPDLSTVYFELYPDLSDENKPKEKWGKVTTVLMILGFKKSSDPAGVAAINKSRIGTALKKPLLDVEGAAEDLSKSQIAKQLERRGQTNIQGANVIVLCDVLNAFATGMSLKFMDLFLIQDYDLSPASVLSVAVASNLMAAWLTPVAKASITSFKKHGYQAKLAVAAIWLAANVCLGVICVPNCPCWLAVIAIVLFNGLGSCTKAFNRAKLVNYLPQDRIANYMAWDSLNKANQGGVAIFGAQLLEYGGYRCCFMVTWLILFIRIMIYFIWTVMGKRKKKPLDSRSTFLELEQLDDFDAGSRYSINGDVGSELFLDSALRVTRDGDLEDRDTLESTDAVDDVLSAGVVRLDTIEDVDEGMLPSPGSPRGGTRVIQR